MVWGRRQAREHTLTKRSDLEHTRYANQSGVQYPAVTVTVYPNVFQGPESGTLRNHDMAVAKRACRTSGLMSIDAGVTGRC
jgi:hypothetical protein